MAQVRVNALDRGVSGESATASGRDAEWWVEPLRWVALAVWIGIPILALTEQPFAGRVVWTIAVASLPLFIVLIGYHRWRRICPLAFCNQIMVKLRRPGSRRMPQAIEDRYYAIPVTLFTLGLWLRLIWTNGDGDALAIFFVGLSVVAFLVGTVFTGKTWCNYICPVSFIEKIYTEPHGLRETRNSQCTKCTACKKACPDINQENGYWKEIDSSTKRFAYFAYPGLVLGFYTYYWLQSGTWDYYFSGSWTDQPGVIWHAFLPGTDAATAGFFFLPFIPRALAALLTLIAFALVSYGIFWLLEPRIGQFLRRRDPSVDALRARHVTFGIAAFTAFVTFYSFAGQPTLRKVEWLPGITSVLIVLTASLFLIRRLTRTPQAFAEQSVARNIIKRWEWTDVGPPKDLHDAVVMHTARVSERDRAYAQVLEAYREAVRETVATGLATREEVQRLEALRNQLQIKRADHERVMATLAEEERAMLSDPLQQPSAEQRLQLESYARTLAQYLERAPGVVGSGERFIHQLRQEFRVTPEQHQAILNRLLEPGEADSTFTRMVDDVQSIEDATRSIEGLSAQSSPSATYLADLLQRLRHRTAVRLVNAAGPTLDVPTSEQLVDWLEADDGLQRSVAIGALCKPLPGELADRLNAAYTAAAAQPTFADIPEAYSGHPDAYIRSAALYLLAERDGVLALDRITASVDDEHELVRGTATGLRRRLTEPDAAQHMLAIENMIALRCVPIFASLGPIELEELAQSTTDRLYAQDTPLCLAGDPGDEVFVVLRGTVVVVDGRTPRSPQIRVETTGSVIGEMAVLDPAPRSASTFAGDGGAHVLCLKGDAFRFALNADPRVAEGVMRTLARRIRSREVSEPMPTLTSATRPGSGGLTMLSVLAISTVIAASLLLGGTTANAEPKKSHACDGCPGIFRAFDDADGKVQSDRIDNSLDATNAMFSEDLGKNGQACYDCHQPRQGFTIQVPFIQSTFDETAGLDTIFALNDTASRPDADISTIDNRRTAFSLFLNLGIVRIGKSQAAGDFIVSPQNTSEFGQLPKPSCASNDPIQSTDCDPQGMRGPATLSVFRRPLVNTNVFFDSAVLWDGRASIANMDGQAKRAAQTLLLSETCDAPTSPTPCTPTISPAQVHDIARFMTGVFTAQDTSTTAGALGNQGALGGVRNLVALAGDPRQPCRTGAGMLTPFTPSTCTPAAAPAMTLFNAWADLPDSNRDAARLAIARGQALFNGGLQIQGFGTVTSCSSCHALNNVGNSPSDTAPLSFVRLGLDSPDFLARLSIDDARLASFVSRTSGLPVYTVTGATCPSITDPITSAVVAGTNTRSSDPGRALVSGHCADLGEFKPPVLRNLAVRAPYFHNAAAASLDDVVNFYDVRFHIGISTQQHSDLIAFLKSL